jgi:hypothetical protein
MARFWWIYLNLRPYKPEERRPVTSGTTRFSPDPFLRLLIIENFHVVLLAPGDGISGHT